VFAASSAKRLRAAVRTGRPAAERRDRSFQTPIAIAGQAKVLEVQALAGNGKVLGTSRPVILAGKAAKEPASSLY
jgi:hypothetical protein